MITTAYISSYLEPTRLHTAHRLNRRQRLSLATRGWRLPIWRPRLAVGAVSWVFLIIGTGAALGQYTLPDPGHVASDSSRSTLAAAKLASAIKVPELPAGPTGQLLPPGTMAAAYTFRNSYSRGQCTWYVAGRRSVPNNWGNARSWYGGAHAAGWNVGPNPAIGAIAWTPSGWYGHVALVEAIEGGQVLISEMNYLGAYKIDKRWVASSSFRYIY